MISKFTLQNLSTLETVVFGQDFDCDYIYESGGLDWGNIPANHSVYSYPNQIGDSFSSTKVNNRDISIEAYAFYVLTEDERISNSRFDWNSISYEKIKEKKALLNRLINPLDTLRLTIGNYFIEGKASATPQYGVEEKDNNIHFCKFAIGIFCANPMFKKITEEITVIAGDTGAFVFPLVLPPSGLVVGVRDNYLMLDVDNEGDIEIGGVITITAKNTIVNPVIENVGTGEQIILNHTMVDGEVIVINTSDGSKKGIWGTINGVTSSYLYMWDFSNTWMKFKPGRSIVSYSCDNGEELNMDVKIEINPAKYGLEDM